MVIIFPQPFFDDLFLMASFQPCVIPRERGPQSGAGVFYGKNRKWHPPKAGRRLAFRAAFALHLYTQPCTPFCRCAAFPLKGKQGIVPLPPAPLETESTKHRFPLRPLEGERATKRRGGCCTARASNDHSIQAGRRLAVRAAFALHLYTQPRTPFCRCAAFPLKGKQEIVPLNLAPP